MQKPTGKVFDLCAFLYEKKPDNVPENPYAEFDEWHATIRKVPESLDVHIPKDNSEYGKQIIKEFHDFFAKA